MTEIWKDVVGYEGYYQVSNLGRVKNSKRGVILSRVKNKDGYIQRILSKKGKRKNVMDHQLVAQAFLGPAPSNCIPLHQNHDRSDNRVSNLRWGTVQDNTADRLKSGIVLKGEDNPSAKLTENQAKYIKYTNLPAKELARMFNIGLSTVYIIKAGKIWSHI